MGPNRLPSLVLIPGLLILEYSCYCSTWFRGLMIHMNYDDALLLLLYLLLCMIRSYFV
jgi:hypothetical protein